MKPMFLIAVLLPLILFSADTAKKPVIKLSENLFINPDLARGGDTPDGWKISLMAKEVFNVRYKNKGTSAATVEIESLGADYSGYINQNVKVEPNCWYRIKVTTRLLKGRGLIWVYGYGKDGKQVFYDKRKYLHTFVGHPLVPHFVRKEYMNGTDDDSWRVEVLDIYTGATKGQEPPVKIRVSAGVYFATTRIVFKNLEIYKIEKPGGAR
ncbi:MAG: hypothetical protein KAI66_23465 [Lentisphaeria bacterium]|nr:hypothetical protein [Lentisphaeria bacterium]